MKHTIPLMTILSMIVASCSETQPPQVHRELNSVYYWKTVFHLDSADIAFIKKHDIGRIFLRMFDVSEDTYAHAIDEKIVPNASVRIDRSGDFSAKRQKNSPAPHVYKSEQVRLHELV